MHVAIVIVGFRNPDDILRCLGALAHSSYADFEVMICENGGPGSFAELGTVLPTQLSSGQPVRAVLAEGNLGYAGGVNLCLQETSEADAWWILNPDTEPHETSLALQVERLVRGDCDAVGCTLYLPEGVVQSYGGAWRGWLARPVSLGHGVPLESPVDAQAIEARQSYLNGASMLVGRRFLQVVGLMRDDYFLYCEEVEWCLRGIARGMRLGFAEGALVLHHQGTSTGNVRDIRERSRMPVYLNERNKLNVTRDIFPERLASAALFCFANLFLRYGRRGAWRQLGYGLSGWIAGIRNERGVPARGRSA